MESPDIVSISTIGFLCVFGLGLSFLVLPRRLAMLPLIASACFIPLSQGITISVFHFNAMRIIIFFGWLRLFIRRELSPLRKLNAIDKVIIAYAIVGFIDNMILFQTSGALVYQLGFLYNTFGIYLLCRSLIRDCDDIERTLELLALCLTPLAAIMTAEMFTGRNAFSIFGNFAAISEVRGGTVRCSGPFAHPILAGTVGATSIPLFAGLLTNNAKRKVLEKAAIMASFVIVITSHSSGPLMACISGLIGLLSWPWRAHTRRIRWGIVVGLLSLHMIMKAPVWYLIDRMSSLVGGGGWHRSHLINQAIVYFSEWWLIGTKYTAHWMPTTLASSPDSADITNHFIAQGVSGGMPKLLLFVAIIVICFKTVGMAVQNDQKVSRPSPFMAWCLGASLLAHVVSFISVSYFDQITVFWYMLLAFIAVLRCRTVVVETRI